MKRFVTSIAIAGIVAIVAIVTPACKERSPQPSKPAATRPAKKAPAKKASAKKAPAKSRAVKSTAPPAAAPPARRPAAQAPLEATVKRPSLTTIQRVGGAGLRRARAHGRGVTLGGTRHAAVISALSRGKDKFFESYLVVLEQADGAWRLQHRLKFAAQTGYTDEGGWDNCSNRIRVRMTARDYDWDGRPEVRLLYRICQDDDSMMRGDYEHLYLQIYNVEGAPRVALPRTQIEDCEDERNRARPRHRDLDGDGHPDVVVKTVMMEGETLRLIYDPATDRYAPRKPR
jgi:hypothetical protein